jgi:hypothetical protein
VGCTNLTCAFVFLLVSSVFGLGSKGAGNVGGSTNIAAVITYANGGGLSTGDAGNPLQHLVIQRVALEDGPMFKAIAVNGPLQAFYSELVPFTLKSTKPRTQFIKRKNAVILKQIAAGYTNAQLSGFDNLIIDVLPILVKGEKGFDANISLPFASFIANELVKNGVKNVRLNHVPLELPNSGQTPTKPDTKPATKS